MATISQAEWKRYTTRLSKINKQAEEEFRKFVADNLGYGRIERQRLIDYGYALATKYGEASAALSAEMYDAVAELSGAVVPSAVPSEITYQDVAKTVNGIIKKTASEQVLAQGISRLVKMAGTDTILSNAYRDRPIGKGSKRKHSGAQVAWIPSGDTCPFCLMLASKGWQKQTQWGANNHSEHIHANCDCTYAVRFNNNLSVDGYDPLEYKAMYNDADGRTRDEKLKSMRDKYREENRDKINAQNRANYEERNRRLDYGNPKTFVKGPKTISASPVVRFGDNNLYVADDVKLTKNEVRLINTRITRSKEILNISKECDATVIVVNDSESLASYNPRTNILYMSSKMTDEKAIIELQEGFAASQNPNSTMVHELIHWEDANDYRKNIGLIDSAEPLSDYSVYQREKAIENLEKEGIDITDMDQIKEISEYAYRKCLENDFEEVYTEYRTKSTLKGV